MISLVMETVPASTEDEVQAWVYLITLAIPLLVAVINQPSWTPTVKRWVTIGVAAVVGLFTLWLQHAFDDLNQGNAFQHIVLIVGAAQIWYAALTAVPVTKRMLKRIERATSKQPDPPAPPQAVK